jgi:energy-coupling factor transporter ATP-binding protein EcfA2
MPFTFPIPTPGGLASITVEQGSSLIFVGANGGGKTRLAAHIETALNLNAHRISAHRALALNPSVAKISEKQALAGLRTGNPQDNAQVGHRLQIRWQRKIAVSLLNDFDFLIQALFADQANKALETHRNVRAGKTGPASPTKMERLLDIWQRLLPDRHLHVSGDDIQVSLPRSQSRYDASELSDGERAIFYMIGQTLAAADNSLLLFDEPELHVHRSIMSKLWDELEAARPDCAFVFITHDLEFDASRIAQKFVVRDFDPAPRWTIEAVPEATGFDEELATLILGSRRPVLFVEGDEASLDQAIYRCCFSEWTVIPKGSCEEVIHSVVTMRRNQQFTRVTCSGIVDADDYEPAEIARLADLGVAVLPVSEIENIVLLPPVSRAIAESEGYAGEDLEARLNALKAAVFDTLNSAAAIDLVVTRHCRRRIDRTLKKLDLSGARTVADIDDAYRANVAALDVLALAQSATDRIHAALQAGELPTLLANYDNKGLIALAAAHLKASKLVDFENWMTRILRNDKAPAIVTAIRNSLPSLHPR